MKRKITVVLILSLILMMIMPSAIFSADMNIAAWTYSGPGLTTLVQDGSDGIKFIYDLHNAELAGHWWNISSIAETDETFTFYWAYLYKYASYDVEAQLIAYAKQPDGNEQSAVLYCLAGGVPPPHTLNGVSCLELKAGCEYGYRIYSRNRGAASYLSGSLRIKEKIIDIDIDIKPGGYPNSINLRSNSVLPVAILTTTDFDAACVDPETVKITGSLGSAFPVKWELLDVPEVWDPVLMAYAGDGDPDLVLYYDTQELNGVLGPSDTEAGFTGNIYGGVHIRGTDSVRLIVKK